jgi:hypothetical protein
LQGQDSVNNLETRTATSPVVEVRDSNDVPVAAAEVTFELPQAGPGAFFEGQQTKHVARSDLRGQAAVPGYRPNSDSGRFQIKVTASSAGRTGSTTIRQTNSAKEFSESKPDKRMAAWKKLVIWGAIIGTGAGLGIYFATRDEPPPPAAPPPPPPTIIISPGAPVIGGPR